jgi:hypothetical protein
VTDLALLEDDGWTELDDVVDAVQDGDLDAERLWEAIGDGDERRALELLERAGYEDLPAGPGARVVALYQPDAALGSLLRVWVADVAGDDD